MQFQELLQNEIFSATLIADTLRTTKAEIADTLGLAQDAFSRRSRLGAKKTQMRLRQMLEILHRVEQAAGSPLAAYAWFRAEPWLTFSAQIGGGRCCRDGFPHRKLWLID